MKEITTKSGKVLLVKVPEDAGNFSIHNSITNWKLVFTSKIQDSLNIGGDMIILPILDNKPKPQILGKFSELKEEDFKNFVDVYNNGAYRDYKYTKAFLPDKDADFIYLTSKESFQSLAKSQGLDDDLDNYLIIKVL